MRKWDTEEACFNVKEVAFILGVCEETVRIWARKGKIRFFQVSKGGVYRIPLSALKSLRRHRLLPGTPEVRQLKK